MLSCLTRRRSSTGLARRTSIELALLLYLIKMIQLNRGQRPTSRASRLVQSKVHRMANRAPQEIMPKAVRRSPKKGGGVLQLSNGRAATWSSLKRLELRCSWPASHVCNHPFKCACLSKGRAEDQLVLFKSLGPSCCAILFHHIPNIFTYRILNHYASQLLAT
eukprot:6188171-Pleurochrysis_carterae.AAC.3